MGLHSSLGSMGSWRTRSPLTSLRSSALRACDARSARVYTADTWARHTVRVSYLIRVVLPDRPGALGAVASALGHAGGDILSVDIVERSAGQAIDDLVVELPPDRLADSLVTAAASVAGVRVESIRPYAGVIDPFRELELLEKLAVSTDDAPSVLADGFCRLFRAGWALVLEAPDLEGAPSTVIARSSAAPEIDTLPAPWWPPTPSRALNAEEAWAPTGWARMGTELAVVPLGRRAILVGRPALRWLASEIMRMSHLASIAATVLDPHPA
jgi:ACT domain